MARRFRMWIAVVACACASIPAGEEAKPPEKNKPAASADERGVKKLEELDDIVYWALFWEMCDAVREFLGSDDILVPRDIVAKAEIGDHFETINPDRPDTHNAFGDPESRVFHSVRGRTESKDAYGSTYGNPGGGGRRLMVTARSAKLTEALMKCMCEGFQERPGPPTEAQRNLLTTSIRALGAEEFKEREAATQRILKVGIPAIPILEETLKTARDPEVQQRAKALLRKLLLAAALANFKTSEQNRAKQSSK